MSEGPCVRVAAAGDIHVGEHNTDDVARAFAGLNGLADLVLVAGDLTTHGEPEQGAVVGQAASELDVPVVAVLGNHDYHCDRVDDVTKVLEDAGIQVLEGTGVVLDCLGVRLGIAGAKGFGGGFVGACAADFGEREMKDFVATTRRAALALGAALGELDTELRVALLHYSPVRDTLHGEKPEIYPFLGSYLLAEAIDAAGADLVVHGHAHHGREKGVTPGGIHVRNVAQPVLRRSYAVYCLGDSRDG